MERNILASIALVSCAAASSATQTGQHITGGTAASSPTRRPTMSTVRVPAEWEPHAATWMQWPRWYESSYRATFADIIYWLQFYEPVQLVVNSASERNQARSALQNWGVPLGNVTFHVRSLNSAWMRDNGPVWIEDGTQLALQDWGFDGWGGLTNDFQEDDAMPAFVASQTGVPFQDWNHLIHERGDLEFNGTDTVIVSWPCFGGRNPGRTQAELESALRVAFGVTRVVWLMEAPAGDVTGGHVDGIARFISESTVVVPQFTFRHPDRALYDNAATRVEAAGLQVTRMPVPGEIHYGGEWLSAIYVNWLVANGVVIMPGFGHAQWDQAAKSQVESFFPGRDVVVVDTRELWYWGGSVHCVTNDQPR